MPKTHIQTTFIGDETLIDVSNGVKYSLDFLANVSQDKELSSTHPSQKKLAGLKVN